MLKNQKINGLQVIGTCKEKSEVEYLGNWSNAVSYFLLQDQEGNLFYSYGEGYSVQPASYEELIISREVE